MQKGSTRGALAALVLAALVLEASASRRATSAVSLAEARAWLGNHGPQPQEDELKDLRNENPEAYALVKALLTKRSLGLLDPRHPTASFAAPAAQASAGPAVSSVDFAASQGVTGKSQALEQKSTIVDAADAYPEAPTPRHTHQDWLSWRPADSAADDDAQVAQVLGAVAQLKGGAAAGSLAVTGQRMAQAAQPQPVEVAQEPNSYLKGIDFGADARTASQRPPAAENPYLKATGLAGTRQVVSQRAAPAAAAAPAEAAQPKPRQNSYLKDIGLAEAKHAVSQEEGEHNYLTDFSWSDDDDSKAHKATGAHVLRRQPALDAAPQIPQAFKKNSLVAWLGSGSIWSSAMAAEPSKAAGAQERRRAPAARPAEAPGGHYNIYLKDLQ